MNELVNKEYLSKQFTGYSEVVKEQLNKKVDKTELENYYTSDEVDEIVENFSTGDVDLSDYFTTSEMEEYVEGKIENLATTEYVDNAVSNVTVDLTGYATETFVTNKIAEAQLDGSDVDLTGLATKEELATKADTTHTHTLVDISDYETPDLSEYALKTELPSTDGFVTAETLNTTLADYAKSSDVTEYDDTALTERISNVETALDGKADTSTIPDVSNFVEKEDGKGLFSGSYNDLTDQPTIPSVDGLVSEEQLTQTLADYAKTEDLPSEYDDTALSDRVTANEEAIATLNGTGEGSVSKSVDDALNKFATDLSDDGVVNTYKELVDYAANHSSDVVEMVADIAENTTAIEELNTKVADIETSVENVYSKDETYSRTEIDTAITNAQLGGEEVDLTEYIKEADADEKYVLDEEIEVLSEADVLALLNMSDEELANLSSMFLDTEVRIDRGWSSSAIYTKLQENLDLAKTYTLEEIAKAAKASYKVVSSTSDVTETIYIYLIANTSNSYDMYILDTDTSSAVQIGTTEIDLSGFYTKTESEDLFATKANLVANYATKQEVVDGYATKTELQDAIDDVEVEISETENNQIQTLEDGLFVDSETVTISKADYDALSDEEKSNGKTYFVPDDETTEDGTDLTQFAKVSDLEETNNKIEEINTDLGKKLSLSGGEMSGGIEMKGNTIGSVGDIFLNDKGAFLNALLTNMSNNLAQLIKTTIVTASADMAANSYAFIRVSPPETPSGYRHLFAFIQGGSGSIDTSQLLVGSGTTGCRVYNNLSQKQTVTIECRIVYIKNC